MIKFTLYENAIESINHGIDHLEYANENNSDKDVKHAILLLFQGSELLLKSLLGQINVIYIFDKNSLFDKCIDPLNPTIDELEKCKSLEINKLCKEIYKYYPDEFPKNSLRIVERMAKIRNQIQHFGIRIEKSKAVSMIGELYFNTISIGMKLFGSKISPEKNVALQEEAHKLFSFFENAENEERMLTIMGEKFSKGACLKCNNYSLFMKYSDRGYPEEVYCSSCEFDLDNIDIDRYRICPECGANSLLYLEEEEYGLCTWYRCCTHSDGGIPIEMKKCENCEDYVIEGQCICGFVEE